MSPVTELAKNFRQNSWVKHIQMFFGLDDVEVLNVNSLWICANVHDPLAVTCDLLGKLLKTSVQSFLHVFFSSGCEPEVHGDTAKRISKVIIILCFSDGVMRWRGVGSGPCHLEVKLIHVNQELVECSLHFCIILYHLVLCFRVDGCFAFHCSADDSCTCGHRAFKFCEYVDSL